MSAEPVLAVDHLSVRLGRSEVLRDVTFSVGAGELLSLLGPNGSGKTTLLRTIAGFEVPSAGTVRLEGTDLAGVPVHRRSIGLLFQNPVLFSRRTVLENIAYAPLLQRRPEAEVRSLVGRLAGLLSLSPLLERAPGELSGGQQQRVALARTLAARPKIVLLDEPFASIDPEIRADLYAEFRAALQAFGTAAIHVTHDREEGLFLGDRTALLFDGRLDPPGAPGEVFARPRSNFAARFLGYNLLPGPRGEIAVLPEDLRFESRDGEGVRATVRTSGPFGRGYLAILSTEDGSRVTLRTPQPLAPGAEGRLRWDRAVELPPSVPRPPPAEPKSRRPVGAP
jgi:ABC-type Fe3+/spermidine/putrescine transport system ATPase subunit